MTKRTKETSRLVGVSRRTLQYYDEEGVICVGRTKNNHRIYDQNTLGQIWRVMVYKEMGFTLKEIKNLLEISDHEQKERCEARLQTVRKQMKEMKKQTEFIAAVIKGGIPDAPEEDIGVTYAEYMESIRNRLQEKNADQVPDTVKIRQLRYRLDEAYQQMQQGNFRYALFDAETVMYETLKLLDSVKQQTAEAVTVREMLEICESDWLLGEDEKFKKRLHEVCRILVYSHTVSFADTQISRKNAYFVIMQIKDLINFTEGKRLDCGKKRMKNVHLKTK